MTNPSSSKRKEKNDAMRSKARCKNEQLRGAESLHAITRTVIMFITIGSIIAKEGRI
jgi:hypothetical protein